MFLRIARGTGKAGVVIKTLGIPSRRVARQRKAMKDLKPSDGIRTCCETNWDVEPVDTKHDAELTGDAFERNMVGGRTRRVAITMDSNESILKDLERFALGIPGW